MISFVLFFLKLALAIQGLLLFYIHFKIICSSSMKNTLDILIEIGKGAHQVCILSPCLFKLHAENIMQNAKLDESQAGI